MVTVERPPTPIPSSASTNALSFFNQRCVQLDVTSAWVEVPSGPANNRNWNVQCLGKPDFGFLCRITLSSNACPPVDGTVCGSGRGGDKKSAKRVAAAQALLHLGWVSGEWSSNCSSLVSADLRVLTR